MDYEINDNVNQIENENEANHNPAQFFKVTPDDYTESDSNTIIDFDDEDDTKTQNQIEKQNQEENQASENHEEYLSHEEKENIENEEHNLHEENHEEEEQENKNSPQREGKEFHPGGEDHQNSGKDGEQEQEQEGEGEQEQENQEDNDEEENGRSDPNVKQLMKMDLADKDGIIDLLMKDNLVKKYDVKNEKLIKEKNRAKFEHVESTIGKRPIGNKKNTYGRKGFQIVSEEGNPEFIKDMNIASYAVKDQIEEENQDVAKILFDEVGAQKINKRITREQIDEKVKKNLLIILP